MIVSNKSDEFTWEQPGQRHRFHHVEKYFDEDQQMFELPFDHRHHQEQNEPNQI